MAAATEFGAISADEAYCVEALTRIFNVDKEWVRDSFIRPINRNTKKRLTDPETGNPLPGVRHVRLGNKTIVTGRDLINWIAEYGAQMGE